MLPDLFKLQLIILLIQAGLPYVLSAELYMFD